MPGLRAERDLIVLNVQELRWAVYVLQQHAPISQVTKAVPPEARSDVEAILTEVDPLRHIREAAPAKLFFQDGRRDEVVPRAPDPREM